MEQEYLTFSNRIMYLYTEKDHMEFMEIFGDSDSRSRYIPKKPVKDDISELWLENNAFADIYKEIRARHYGNVRFYDDAKKLTNFEARRNEYPTYIMYSIGPKGKPEMMGVSDQYYRAAGSADPSSAELDAVTEKILSIKKALFKNKKKLNALTERHKMLREELRVSYGGLPKAVTERVFLNTFAFSYELGSFKKYHLVRDIFFEQATDIRIPLFFFGDSLYAEKGKEYKTYNLPCRIELMPKAAVALITKDLQAADGDAFFKKGVTVEKVLAEVKKRAEAEVAFAEKFDLAFIEELVEKQMKQVRRKSNEELVIRIPYMGLNYLNDGQLTSVAEQLFRYFSLFAQYVKYETWFKNYPMANYLKALNPPPVKKEKEKTMADWEAEAVKVLPAGRRDLPYFDLYFRLVRENRFDTYYGICNYVRGIREQDEYRRKINGIAANQKVIIQQNNAILHNQVKLHEQNEQHHKERLAQERAVYQGIMSKLDDVQKSVDRAYYTIYY